MLCPHCPLPQAKQLAKLGTNFFFFQNASKAEEKNEEKKIMN